MIVRITRARIRPNTEAHVFDTLRAATKGLHRPAGLESLHIGRRMDNSGHELVAVTVWHDTDTMIAALGERFQASRFLRALDPYLEGTSVQLFESVVDAFEEIAATG